MSIIQEKLCPQCKEYYPKTNEFWYKEKRNKDNLYWRCIKCCREERVKWYQKNKEESNRKGQEWRKNNYERVQEVNRKYHKEHPELVKEIKKKWQEENRDKYKEACEKYRKNNPDKVRESNKQWAENNPEKVLANTHRRRARKLSAEGFFTEAEVMELFQQQEGYCFHCGKDLILIGFTRDHWIPLIKGGSNWISNIRLMCPHCNYSKGSKYPWEWDARYENEKHSYVDLLVK